MDSKLSPLHIATLLPFKDFSSLTNYSARLLTSPPSACYCYAKLAVVVPGGGRSPFSNYAYIKREI